MHGQRVAYYVCGENILSESPVVPGSTSPERVPPVRFGRLFGRTQKAPPPEERDRVVQKLVRLGQLMNERTDEKKKGNSDIPAGYTYLGQFIAHEVTHDSTGNLLAAELKLENLSTPALDLDSLYGGEDGPKKRPELYLSDGIRLRTNLTPYNPEYTPIFPNDLPRGAQSSPDDKTKGNPDDKTKGSPNDKTKGNPNEPLLGDPRNAENLTLAQTHVAFIHFHNRVVDDLVKAGCPADKLFERTRAEVIRHYQWIILYDFLPRLVRADVLDCVMSHGLRWFKGDGGDGLFMPLEFSAAAFRIGHTMVRATYEWNPLRRTGSGKPPDLKTLFKQTGRIEGGHKRLMADWVIDWRHFYDFEPLKRYRPVEHRNVSAKLDTVFNMHLDDVTGAPDEKIEQMQKAITVRNLLRGFYLGLPTGEEAAEWMGEKPLTRKQLAEGLHEGLLDDPAFWGKTPLWYYVLKEAELLGFNEKDEPGNRLGPVGSRIVAETLIGLIENSPISIINDKDKDKGKDKGKDKDKDWRPTLGRASDDATGRPKFEMIDLLDFARVVSPIAEDQKDLFV